MARLIQPFRIERIVGQMNEEQLKAYQNEYHEITEHFMEFHNYLVYNNIFLSSDLYAEFRVVDKLFHTNLVKSRIAKEGLSSSELTFEVLNS